MDSNDTICCRYCGFIYSQEDEMSKYQKAIFDIYKKIDERYNIDTSQLTELQRDLKYFEQNLKIYKTEKEDMINFKTKLWAIANQRCPSCLHVLEYEIQQGLPESVVWHNDKKYIRKE